MFVWPLKPCSKYNIVVQTTADHPFSRLRDQNPRAHRDDERRAPSWSKSQETISIQRRAASWIPPNRLRRSTTSSAVLVLERRGAVLVCRARFHRFFFFTTTPNTRSAHTTRVRARTRTTGDDDDARLRLRDVHTHAPRYAHGRFLVRFIIHRRRRVRAQVRSLVETRKQSVHVRRGAHFVYAAASVVHNLRPTFRYYIIILLLIPGDVVGEMVFFVRNKSDRRELLASMASVDHVSSHKIHDNGIIF